MVEEQSFSMQDLRNGSHHAFKSFFVGSYREFFSFANLLLRDATSSRNVVGEAFFMLWKKRADFDNEPDTRAFLYTAVRTHCLNFLQYRQKYPGQEAYVRDAKIAASLPPELLQDLMAFMEKFTPHA